RLVPLPDRGQDRHGREDGLPAGPEDGAEPESVLVVRLRADGESDDRRLRADRERRPRRHRGRSRSAEGVRAVLRPPGDAARGGALGLMVLVLLAAPFTRGSKRWIDVGFFRFQPSEFGKLLFVLALAGFLADRARRISTPRTTLQTVGLAAVPIFLVFLQPDLGTALVYGAALAAILFVAGTRWTQIALLAGGALVFAVLVLWGLPSVGQPVLKHYQQDRLLHWTNPDSDPGGATYNAHQSILAIGAGGVHGRGVANATQTNLDFLPEH